MPAITFNPVAYVSNSRQSPEDDHWGSIVSELTLADQIPTKALDQIEAFSHLEIIYYFDKVDASKMVYAGIPRENPKYPRMGIFAQRKKDRPNAIGLCTVELLSHNGRSITVRNLDAINGTPVLDIKPVFKEFQARGEIRQAAWVEDLMAHYW